MTRAQIKTAIRAKGYETDVDTAMNEAISTVDRRVQGMRRWPWLETVFASATVADTSTLAFPATARDIDAIWLQDAQGNGQELAFRPYAEVRDMIQMDQDTGTPRFWARRGRLIYFYPIPDLNYTISIDGIANPTTIDDDADVPITPVEYHDLYVWGSVAQLAARQRDWNAYNAATGEYTALLREMIAEVFVQQRQNSRQVVRSSFWRTVHTPHG